MTTRVALKRDYNPIRNAELGPVAEVYKALLTSTGVLALFTAKDGDVDGGWVTDFETAITAVGNIVPSKTIISTNKDITKSIKLNSKKSVAYGKVLAYYLKKAFPDQPGLVASFPIVAANKKMALGDTEGFLYEVNTIIEQLNVSSNQAALVAKNWPTSNLTDYQDLQTSVGALNTQQEVAKTLVPENTDAAIVVRNTCYGFIDTLVELKDIVYETDKQKRHAWAVSTILNQIRGGTGGKKVRQGSLAPLAVATIDFSTIGEPDDDTPLSLTAKTADMFYYASATKGTPPPPGATGVTVIAGTTHETVSQDLPGETGLDPIKIYLNVQNVGSVSGKWRFEVG